MHLLVPEKSDALLPSFDILHKERSVHIAFHWRHAKTTTETNMIEFLPKPAGIHSYLLSWEERFVMVSYCAEPVWQFGLHRAFRDLLMMGSHIGYTYMIYLQVYWYKNTSWVKYTNQTMIQKSAFTKFYRTESGAYYISS